MKISISRVNKTQIWSGINCVDYFLLLLKCISYFSSTCLTSTRSHTLTHIRWDAHLLTFSVHHFAVAMPRAYCPGTAESLKLHTTCWFFRSPCVAHTNIFSPSCRSHSLFFLSVLHTQTHSLSPLHTHREFSPLLPYLLSWQREKLLLAGLFHSEAVAHQRRSRSGGWSCGGGGGRKHEMGTMNGPDSTLRRESGRPRWLRARVARRAPASDCDAAAAATITQIAMLP